MNCIYTWKHYQSFLPAIKAGECNRYPEAAYNQREFKFFTFIADNRTFTPAPIYVIVLPSLTCLLLKIIQILFFYLTISLSFLDKLAVDLILIYRFRTGICSCSTIIKRRIGLLRNCLLCTSDLFSKVFIFLSYSTCDKKTHNTKQLVFFLMFLFKQTI